MSLSNPQNLPLVSIISVHYNTFFDTMEFLKSVRKLTYPAVEVVIVDNSNDVALKDELDKNYPEVKLILNPDNIGFAAANNVGIRNSTGKYFFFLNTDTILFPDFIEPIVEFFEAHPSVGMASPKVLFGDGVTIQYAGARAINASTGRGRRYGLMEPDRGQYDYIEKTQLGHGAALIVPRSVTERVGLWPEDFFLYYEEHDWCEQVKRAGYFVYYLGYSKIIHKESASIGGSDNPRKAYYMTRSRLLFMRRNSKGWSRFSGILFFALFTVPKHFTVYLLKGQFKTLGAFFSAIAWHLKKPKPDQKKVEHQQKEKKKGMLAILRKKYDEFKMGDHDNSMFDAIGYVIEGFWGVFIAKWHLRRCTRIGKFVSVKGKPIVINKGEIVLGDEVRVWSSIVTAKLYTGKGGKLIVGRNSRLNGVHIDARVLVQIGDNVRMAPYTIILDSDFHDVKDHFSDGLSKPTIIEDNVWLATRSTILKGVRIGKGSVVAAGAVVTKDVPPNCIVAGVPAKVIRRIG